MDEQKEIQRRIGRLNHKGVLAAPISCSDVIGPLSELGLAAAEEILADVEEKGSQLRNPTAYILAAFNGDHDASYYDADELAEDQPPRPRGNTKARDDDPSKRIARQVGWLNAYAGLSESISYNEVIDPLMHLEIAAALKILKDLELAAPTVKNPTAYVLAAVNRQLHRPPPGLQMLSSKGAQWPHNVDVSRSDAEELDPTGKIGRQIGWLNHKASLSARISFSDVVGPLSAIDISEAMSILKDLEQAGTKVSNPTGFISAAANRRLSGSTNKAGRKRSYDALQERPAACSNGLEDDAKKISVQVGWLNKHAGLKEPVSYCDVVESLSAIDISSAMQILKDLEVKAERVSNPTAYVIAAARRVLSPGSSEKRPRSASAQANFGEEGTSISRQIGWLNHHGHLQEKISYSDVVETLSAISHNAALQILKDLESSAARVTNPTAYIIAAAKRQAPAKSNDSTPISKQVGWINNNCNLREKISYSDVVEPLSAISTKGALQILKDLEQTADRVSNPTAYIIAAARRQSSNHSPTTSRTTRTTHSQKQESSNTEISRHIGRLNRNGKLRDKISYSDVKEHLEECGEHHALKILKDLEAASDRVQNPTAYIIAASKRSSSEGQARQRWKQKDSIAEY